MKFLLISILLILNLYAQKKQNVTLGLGAYVQTQPYKGTDTIVLPSPVVFFDNSLFYMRWSRVGVYFYGEKSDDLSWGFSFTAQPRVYGYKASDSSYLKGMNNRDTTLEGGLAFSVQKKDKYVEIILLTDVLHNPDTWRVKTELGDKYTLGAFSFYPSFIVSYQSNKFMDYYYGVKSNEVDLSLNRTQYTANAGFQVGAETYINYPFNDKWSALINLRADLLPSSAKNSPIVENNYIYSGLASLIYTFEY